MSKATPGFSLNSFTMASGDWYKNVSYEDAKNLIKEKMVSSAENFVAIGYYLKHISETGQYKEGGYSNIWECAENEFGFSQAKASRCINICKTYSADGDSPFLGDRFKSFNISQLQEMLPIKDERLIEQITPDMSVKEIRDMRNVESGKEAAEDKILPGQMQIETIEGDFRAFDPVPDNEGDLAVSREAVPEDDDGILEENQEEDKNEPTDEEIRDFYERRVKGRYDCNRDDLKNKLREAMGKSHLYYGEPDGISYQCSPRGVAINSSKEITWTKLVKRISELIPEGEPKNTASAEPAKTVQETVEQGHEITQLPCDEENIEKAVNAIFGLRSSNIFPDSKMNAIVEAFREKKDVNRLSQQLIFNKMLPFKNDIVEVAYQCGYLVSYIEKAECIKIPIYDFWKAFEGCFGWMWKGFAGTEEDDNILIMHESGGEAESADKGCEFQINMERITVRIPCAVGETVFFRDGNEVKDGAVDLITFGEGMRPDFRVYDNKGEWFHFETDDFGKLLFCTYKDAEKGSCN